MATVIHVLPKGIDGWLLKVEGGKVKDGYFATRDEAIRVANVMRDSLNAELVIHGPEGTVTRH